MGFLIMVCKSHKGPLKLYEPLCVSLKNSALPKFCDSEGNLQTHHQITVVKHFLGSQERSLHNPGGNAASSSFLSGTDEVGEGGSK